MASKYKIEGYTITDGQVHIPYVRLHYENFKKYYGNAESEDLIKTGQENFKNFYNGKGGSSFKSISTKNLTNNWKEIKGLTNLQSDDLVDIIY